LALKKKIKPVKGNADEDAKELKRSRRNSPACDISHPGFVKLAHRHN
jgi:hypothetical protein